MAGWDYVRLMALGGLALAAAPAAAGQADITWTEHGIPHVRAANFYDLGFGYGYANAKLDLCGMADMFATFSGRRAELFGADKSDIVRLAGRRPLANPANDAVRRLLLDDATVKQAKAAMGPDVTQLVQGYAAGFNRYVVQTPVQKRPEACRDGSVQKISADDVVRRAAGFAKLLGSGLLLQEIYEAAPPSTRRADSTLVSPDEAQLSSAGSNAYGFGRETTGGSGLLLANPHFFWDGPDRFVEAHLTVPGKYDVMGMSVLGLPLITLGFNNDIAWSHTVSTDKRGALYQLTLDPADPTRYLIDGKSEPMTKREISVRARQADGTMRTIAHTFWLTRWGPVIHSKDFPWTTQTAFALADANRGTLPMLQQMLENGTARSVAELEQRLDKTNGLPWVNTIAADRAGKAFYGDISLAPALDKAALDSCTPQQKLPLANYLAILDGSRSACRWAIMPAAEKPRLTRDDWVENSNNSHWLANPYAPLTGFSPIVGPEKTVLNIRSRQGHQQVLDRLAGTDGLPGKKMTPEALQVILFSGRSLQAELVVDELVRACRAGAAQKDGADLAKACDVLASWDRRYDLDSAGALLFTLFAAQLQKGEDLAGTTELWKVPFDPAQPLTTPRDFNGDVATVLPALRKAIATLAALELPIDAKLGTVQFVTRNGERIPLHGGRTFSVMNATPKKGAGFTDPIVFANSYISTVTWDGDGPVADAVLASSQTPDPASPFYADQTRLYSEKKWVRLPFTRAQIERASIGREVLDTKAR